MANILIVYSSTDGHTIKICECLQRQIEAGGHQVHLVAVGDAHAIELQDFDKIVVGASIRYGKHSKLVIDFIRQHRVALDGKPNAFFSVNIVARKATKNRPETNPYLRKFLRQIDWRPRQLAVFAGKLDYPRYGFFDRQMIRLIMLMTKGPTDPATVVEFTDWQKVAEFGQAVSEM
ncbi:MAG: menaquinone-dependent protoporphyrinogen IX dehydrogenase [Sulfuritalea sp.]|nr:menaquinone-dependent protoporphyrinogen IX dehydrogenase [Sulfuritalea sp.]